MSRSEPVDDLALMKRVAEGDQQALHGLYDRFGGMAYTVALRFTGDVQCAQEVVQDVFLECWRSAAAFDKRRGSVPGWLMTIARNRAIDVLRSSQHHARERERPLPDFDGRWVSRDEGPEDGVLRMSVEVALGSLSPGQREAIQLALFGGMTQQEIATVLAIPLGTVKTRIRDGMVRLRELLLRPQAAKGPRS